MTEVKTLYAGQKIFFEFTLFCQNIDEYGLWNHYYKLSKFWMELPWEKPLLSITWQLDKFEETQTSPGRNED